MKTPNYPIQHTPFRVFRTHPPVSLTPKYPFSERDGLYESFKIADDDQGAGNPLCRGNLLAHIYNHTGRAKELAHLFAAAPDLLAALALSTETLEWVKQWLVDLERDNRTVTRHIVAEIDKAAARAAIARAKADPA